MSSPRKFLLLLLRLLLICLLPASCGGEQKFAMEPQDQTAVVGSRVTLPCRVIGKSGVLQWTKDDFGLGTHRNLSGFDRYSMIGSDEEGKLNYHRRSIIESADEIIYVICNAERVTNLSVLEFCNPRS